MRSVSISPGKNKRGSATNIGSSLGRRYLSAVLTRYEEDKSLKGKGCAHHLV